MSDIANVRSLDAVREFRVAVLKFAEEAVAGVQMLKQQSQRALEWIDQERPSFWRNETRKRFDGVAQARSHLAQRQLISATDRRPACIEEKQALQIAKRKLDHAVGMNEVLRHWNVQVHRATDEYAIRVARLDRILNHDVPRLVGLLERMITALEAYATSETQPAHGTASENNEPHRLPDGRGS